MIPILSLLLLMRCLLSLLRLLLDHGLLLVVYILHLFSLITVPKPVVEVVSKFLEDIHVVTNRSSRHASHSSSEGLDVAPITVLVVRSCRSLALVFDLYSASG